MKKISPGVAVTQLSNGKFIFLTLPLLLGIVIFSYFPLLIAFIYSFFTARNSLFPTTFVGLRNYLDLLHNADFRSSVLIFIIYSIILVPLIFFCALILAVLLHSLKFGALLFQTCIFIPTVCSGVAAAVIWKLSIFNGIQSGLANIVLKHLMGHNPIAWLFTPDPPWYWVVIVSLRLWLQMGFYVILFLAALRRIHPALYEAALMDGAQTAWHKFRYITWPGIRRVAQAIITLLILSTIQAFDEFYNLLGSVMGYPPYGRPPLIYLYYISMGQSQDFGHAGAGAFVLIMIIILLNSSRYINFLSIKEPLQKISNIWKHKLVHPTS